MYYIVVSTSMSHIAEILLVNAITKTGQKWQKNGKKLQQMTKKSAKMVDKNQVGQRVCHTEIPKNQFFANLMVSFNGTPLNEISIVIK